MSSPEEDHGDAGKFPAQQRSKKRRVLRACDVCRRKKVRCDGEQVPGGRCNYCVEYNHPCTYIEASKRRIASKGYVEDLESKLEKAEGLLRNLYPELSLSRDLDKDSGYAESSGASSSVNVAKVSAIPPLALSTDVDNIEPSDDELTAETLENSLKQMQINPTHISYFGKSSSATFLQTAVQASTEYAKQDDGIQKPWLPPRRLQLWEVQEWTSATQTDTHYIFPDDDLMFTLFDLYFKFINDYIPLLHRPTFENNVRAGLHVRDQGFGPIVLLVCAIGSRFSDDPRVLLEGSDSAHSRGWTWFRQVQLTRESLFAPPRLYDVQLRSLSAIFLLGTSAPQVCWAVIGTGIRLALEVGAHRRKMYNTISRVEEELWKRAFWILVYLDRAMSMSLGRPCAIQDEDFDVELPTECDDEYWVISESECQFRQPAHIPSKITYFNCLLRLNEILAFSLRTIYSINKSKVLLGFVGHQWEQRIVAELDSALNKWIDCVPDHLRWDPHREDELFLNQSAYLYAHYYQLQISVHRPFIPKPRKPSPLSFPSLAICTNAARSCVHVLDVPYRRTSKALFTNLITLFTSGIVLLLNIWGGKRSGSSFDAAKEMEDVHICMRMLKSLAPQWQSAGRLCEVLCSLALAGDLPLPQSISPVQSQKRARDLDMPDTIMAYASTPRISQVGSTHKMAGTKRVSHDSIAPGFYLNQQQHTPSVQSSSGQSTPTSNTDYSLPIYTEDLGRMPLHPNCNSLPSATRRIDVSQLPSQLSASQPTGSTNTAASDNADPELDRFMSSIFPPSSSIINQTRDFNALRSVPNGHGAGSYETPISADSRAMDIDHMNDDYSAFTESDTLAMWSNAPQGFEWDDWGSYITSVSDIGNTPNLSRSPESGH